MMQAPHLTDAQFAKYRGRTLAPEDLLQVDRHLAECAACREVLYDRVAVAQVRQLRAELSEHLDYDRIVACVEGPEPPDLQVHLQECAMCRGEVEDLRQFRLQLGHTPQSRVIDRQVSLAPVVMPVRRAARGKMAWLAIAAGIVLVAGLALWSLRRQASAPEPQLAQRPVTPAEPALLPDQREALTLAMATHKLERAPVLDRLITKRGVLLGAPGLGTPGLGTPGLGTHEEGKAFEILAPMGTAVVSDRPTFRWQPVRGATRYVVAVFNGNFEKVTESAALASPEWQPSQPLERGQFYNWQVTAKVGGETVRSPIPPAPEARFQVAPEETAAQIEAARRAHPENHLLLAVLYAKAGALDDAAREVDALAATDAALAKELRDSVNEIRKQ